MKSFSIAGLSLLNALPSTAEYIWPSKYDYLEDILTLQNGLFQEGFIDGVKPCSFSSAGPGRQTAAEWIRTAYHDMATHDAAAGTGGLDASIMFETERDENEGAAFNGTFGFTNNYYNIRASAADLVALSVVVATGACDGPKIPFRAGRIDATEAGPLGVPKPDQDIETHKTIFAKAGFNTSDMIAMVACGHTLGGVHGVDFPQITFNDSETNFEHFETDESFSNFDNKVVTEYLDGTTSNLLVVGKNDTTNSDKRVFSADGNATMRALADPTTFQSTCADILARMIDTVPSNVTLSDPIEPVDIKPYIDAFALNAASTIDFSGRIRVRTTSRDNTDLAVHLTYLDRSADPSSNTTVAATQETLKGGTTAGLFRETFTWYDFSTTLPANTSISAFNVHLTTRSSNATLSVHDNGGKGFPLVDEVLYQQPQSCLNTTIVDGAMDLTIAVAVRKERASEPVKIELVKQVPRQGVFVPALEMHEVAMEAVDGGKEVKPGYVLFRTTTKLEATTWSTTFDVVLGDGENATRKEFMRTNVLTEENCVAL